MKNVPRPRFRTELDPTEELDLIRRAQAGDQRAHGRLLAANAAYLRNQAKRYRGSGLDVDDLEQEAGIGLAEAVAHFDLTYGVRLITYARYWVEHRLRDAALSQGRLIRLPRIVHQGLAASYKTGEEQDPESLVAGGYVADEETARAASAIWGQRTRSLDGDSGSPGGVPLRDRLASPAPTPEDLVAAAQAGARFDLVEEIVGTLPPSEADVIRRRYLTDEPETMQQIADGRGRTRQRIEQIEKSALARLRIRVAERMGDVGP